MKMLIRIGRKRRHDQLLNIARHTLRLAEISHRKDAAGCNDSETFADFRDWKASHLTEAMEYLVV